MSYISGLEIYQSVADWRTRSIVTAAIAQLLWENKDKLNSKERASVIWNLYFALGSELEASPRNPSRMSTIQGLQLLATLYSSDKELSGAIVKELLCLNNKSSTETGAIMTTIVLIFDTTLQGVENQPAIAKHALNHYYALLLDLISTQNESAFDLLAWTVETFFKKLGNRTSDEKISSSEFSIALSNHFQAAPSLIRYGAALALLSIALLQPSFPATNVHIWNFIISGVLDSDFLTAGVYLQLLESVDFAADGPSIKQMVSLLRKENFKNLTYDDIYISVPHKFDSRKNRQQLLDVVVKHAPVLSNAQLHKLANALDFIAPKLKLKQLELIRVWGKKQLNLDIHIMKMLIPLCASPDEEVQLEAIKVLETLLPPFATSTGPEIQYIWGYVSRLLSCKMEEASVCLAAIQLMGVFPALKLNTSAREELLSILFSLCFHKSWEIRSAVYRYLGQNGEVWRSTSQLNGAMAILLLALGDGHAPNQIILVDQIILLGQNGISSLLPALLKFKNAPKLGELELVRTFDYLATLMIMNKHDYRLIIEAMSHSSRVDESWQFFIQGVPENQLVRPEEYDYLRIHVQNPIWFALFYTKFGIPPPPIGEDMRRDVAPNNPIGRRRFICGFLQCILPSLGSSNPLHRNSASVSALLCCFKGNNCHGEILRGLLDFVTQQLLSSKYVTYQISAIDIFRSVIRSKLPGISESIFQQYMELCLEYLHNSHSHLMQIAVLKLFEVYCLVFPQGIAPKLSGILDIVRPLLGDSNSDVSDAAFRVYPLIFLSASNSFVIHCDEMLRNEIGLLSDWKSTNALADPLIANLNNDQGSKILQVSILCLGLLRNSVNPFAVVQFLIPFLADHTPKIRLASFYAIISLVGDGRLTIDSSCITSRITDDKLDFTSAIWGSQSFCTRCLVEIS
jgi:hypothetical protein